MCKQVKNNEYVFYTFIKILSINSPQINHRDPTTAPDAIIGKGNIDASFFLIISFCKINYKKLVCSMVKEDIDTHTQLSNIGKLMMQQIIVSRDLEQGN